MPDNFFKGLVGRLPLNDAATVRDCSDWGREW